MAGLRKINVGEINNKAQEMNTQLTNDNMNNLQTMFSSFSNENTLQGKAWSGCKRYYSEDMVQLTHELQLIFSEIAQINSDYAAIFTEDLDEEQINKQIMHLNMLRTTSLIAPSGAYFATEVIGNCTALIEELSAKKRLISDLDTEGMSILSAVDAFRVKFKSLTEEFINESLKDGFPVERISILTSLDEARNDLYRNYFYYPNGDRNFDRYRQFMERDPKEISDELYQWMIDDFNTMSMEDKEQFIECAYIYSNKKSYSSALGTWTYQYELSDVLYYMTTKYESRLNAELSQNSQNLTTISSLHGDYSLLRTICVFGSETSASHPNEFSDPALIDITLSRPKANKLNNYIIKYQSAIGGNTPGMLASYGFHEGHGINTIFTNQAVDRLILHRQRDEEYANLNAFLGAIPTPANPLGAAVVWGGGVIIDRSRKDDIEGIIALLKDKDACMYLHVNASVGFNGEHYVINYAEIDTESLDASILEYNAAHPNEPVSFTSDDIIKGIKKGNLNDVQGVQEFVDWNSGQASQEHAAEDSIKERKKK